MPMLIHGFQAQFTQQRKIMSILLILMLLLMCIKLILVILFEVWAVKLQNDKTAP